MLEIAGAATSGTVCGVGSPPFTGKFSSFTSPNLLLSSIIPLASTSSFEGSSVLTSVGAFEASA